MFPKPRFLGWTITLLGTISWCARNYNFGWININWDGLNIIISFWCKHRINFFLATLATSPPSFISQTFSQIMKSSILSLFTCEHFVSCIVQRNASDCLMIFFHVVHMERAPAALTPTNIRICDTFFWFDLLPLLIFPIIFFSIYS